MATLVREDIRPGLRDLVTGIRGAVGRRAGWQETAALVSDELRRHLPSPDVLTAEERQGDPSGYQSHTLYTAPDGAFSVVGLVWLPGQLTPIHDHVTWCVFGVIQGVEQEDLYVHEGDHLRNVGTNENGLGDVSGFAPPGDIHRVRNTTDQTAISIHVYGTDISRIDSSIRRVYDLPVR